MPTYCSRPFAIEAASQLVRESFAKTAVHDFTQYRFHIADLTNLQAIYEAAHFASSLKLNLAAPAGGVDQLRVVWEDFLNIDGKCSPESFCGLDVRFHLNRLKPIPIGQWDNFVSVRDFDRERAIDLSFGSRFLKAAAEVRQICEAIGKHLDCAPIFEDLPEGLRISWPGWEELRKQPADLDEPHPGSIWKKACCFDLKIPLTDGIARRVPEMLHWFLTEYAMPGYHVAIELSGRGEYGVATTESFNRILAEARTLKAHYHYAAIVLQTACMEDIGALHFLERNMSDKDQYHIGLGEIQCGKRAVPLRILTMRHRSYLLLQPKAALTAEELAEAGRVVGAEFLPEPISSGKDPLSKTPVLRSDGFYSLENEYCREGIRYYVPDDATVAVPRGTTPENSRSAAAVFLDFSPREPGRPVPEAVAYEYAEIGRKLIRRMKKLYGVVLDFSPESLAVADRLIAEHYPALPADPDALREAARAWKTIFS